ncbi:MAG: CoA pyrophosphatase [Acidobacteria bacterium]|nr:CoA pyrophosphatase [Acidobacteriota bacterium]MBV9070504.1 CoA pyrophosphatase [Acidobacteriota bacterium]MBV9188418.1 CoA pyrophosphatase [Acidobacteriota bacterium]
MPRFDVAALVRLRAILGARPAIAIDAPTLKRAAVLIPIVPNDGGWNLLFSRRSANLAAHSGQIAFPGGGVEADEPLEAAAVREAHEEVGIGAEHIELIGRLDDLVTNSGFLVAPFVGIIDERVDYVLQASEVEEVFEVPIEALLSPSQPEVRYVAFRDKKYPAYFYRHEQYEIWGLTGRILKHFLDFVWRSV